MKNVNGRKAGIALFVSLALAAGVLVLLSWLAEEVLEGDTQRFDEQVRVLINQHAAPQLTAAMRVITYFGSTIVISSLSVCGVVGLYLMKRRRAALLLLVTMAGALILNGVLKLSFHRARPAPFFNLGAPASYSFPSGHALYSFCLFGTLAAIISRRVQSTWTRTAVWAAAALIVVLVGFSRIYLGVHYPSDVIEGYAAAFFWVMAVALADRLFFNSSTGGKS
ncbi:MAG: phosphatase PAP2 family protein [Acidobacteria bacterium]|nr:phosphatase PAP2 family protein [Acidobacteriota bacterium]MBV9958009.1 phosphatase PAP2 family protein [Acidobacteriota bacterium]